MHVSETESKVNSKSRLQPKNWTISVPFLRAHPLCSEIPSHYLESCSRLGRCLLPFFILLVFPKVRYTPFCDAFRQRKDWITHYMKYQSAEIATSSFKCYVKGVKICWFTSGRSERESKRTFWEVTSRERVIQDAITLGPPRSAWRLSATDRMKCHLSVWEEWWEKRGPNAW